MDDHRRRIYLRVIQPVERQPSDLILPIEFRLGVTKVRVRTLFKREEFFAAISLR